ncbi:Non-canonical poly(A) RNA polymerase PAPD5 [Vitis vinifera]|uniref:Non-canonical poly(A) RNA polymerase PAPD5 n=1 Tax=Vitis vinifera TaxID=29760 RepID=A0A438I8Y3_VITVI|nr:Non-canonical poly(A) RNA polymerase PAPD5 [Vitis vinifera]
MDCLVTDPSGEICFLGQLSFLSLEILDFSDFLSPTPEEQSARNAAIESVFNVEVFGSFKTGLYLPTSDIDVSAFLPVSCDSGSDIKTPQIGLYALSRALSQKGIAKKIQVIAKARVPIIKFVEKRSSVAFDISFDVENGPKAAEYIQDAISKWPPLRPLCLILKVFLQQRELNEVYSGGIGSYALLAMLIAMLQNLQEWNASVEHNLGVLLVNFFDFYGRKLNTVDIGVTCNGPGTFFLKSTKGFVNKGQKFLISIEDPQLPGNDIGKNSFNYFQIRSAFSMAFSTLTNARTILGLDPNRSILGTIIRPDPILLERKGGSNGTMTFDHLLPGAGEPLSPQTGAKSYYANWQVEDAEKSHCHAAIQLQGMAVQILQERNGRLRKRDFVTRSTWNGRLHACIFGCNIQFLHPHNQVLNAVCSNYIFMAFADLQGAQSLGHWHRPEGFKAPYKAMFFG